MDGDRWEDCWVSRCSKWESETQLTRTREDSSDRNLHQWLMTPGTLSLSPTSEYIRGGRERNSSSSSTPGGGGTRGGGEKKMKEYECQSLCVWMHGWVHACVCVCACLTACVLLTEAMQIRQVSAPDWNRSLTYWPVLTRPVTSPPGGWEVLNLHILSILLLLVALMLTSDVRVSGNLLQLTCLVGVGVERWCQDPPLFPSVMVTSRIIVFIIIIIILGWGAYLSPHESLSSSLVGLPDFLEPGLDQYACQSHTHKWSADSLLCYLSSRWWCDSALTTWRLRLYCCCCCRHPSSWPFSLLLEGTWPFTMTILTPATPPALLSPGRLHGHCLWNFAGRNSDRNAKWFWGGQWVLKDYYCTEILN